jgi:hypothetical protein
MTRHKSFETAAARRRRDPITWTIDDVTVRLVASVDLADLDVIAEAVLGGPPDPDMKPMVWGSIRRKNIAAAIRQFVLVEDEDAWARLEPDLDLPLLTQLGLELVSEYSGQSNPTQGSESLPNSEPAGATSMDGAPVEESTPSA